MTGTAQQTPTARLPARTPGTRALAWAVLAASLLEVVAPAITLNGPGSSPDAGSGPELLITPAGWAFSIWGVIYALAITQAVGVLAAGAEHVATAQDLARGRPSEIDHLNGTIVRRGAAHGIPTPVNRLLHALVKLAERRD